ncbi:unnamed protein product [Cyprideis torosa]|uniref:Uncharacterized protein n=1 Tax=Cyprideis torosa TaxID=163714 RepID=A0A7R8W3K2_9CRUS|nr:unnamed protein product [Cyprideis torosa]CAG0882245.1 unnamed protein product [Cyprideis torosa]
MEAARPVPQNLEDLSQEWTAKNVLQPKIQEEFVILDYKATFATNYEDRDGYLSEMCRIEIEVELKESGKKKRFDLFAKLYPPTEGHRKMVRQTRAFEREIHAYTSLLEQIRTVQKLPTTHKLEPNWPECVYSIVDSDNNISAIIMEDLKAAGFKVMDKAEGLDFDHLVLSMKAFARSHALTFNVKIQLGIEQMMLRNQQLLDNPLQYFDNLWETGFGVAIYFLREYGRADLADKMSVFREAHGTVMSHANRLLKRPHRMRTLTEGDYWINNMLFRHEIKDGREVPVEVKLVDLQMAHYVHPCFDLVYFLFGASNSQQRNPLDKLLRTYYDTFFNILFQVGSPFSRSDYTYDEFKADFHIYRSLSLIFGPTFIIWFLADPKGMPDVSNLTSDFNVMLGEWMEQQKDIPNAKHVAEKLVDLVEEAELHGVL